MTLTLKQVPDVDHTSARYRRLSWWAPHRPARESGTFGADSSSTVESGPVVKKNTEPALSAGIQACERFGDHGSTP